MNTNIFNAQQTIKTDTVYIETVSSLDSDYLKKWNDLQKILTDTATFKEAKPILLTDSTKALLTIWYDENDGRNFCNKLIVIIPDSNKVYFVFDGDALMSSNGSLTMENITVMDLNKDGISEVKYLIGGSGQGDFHNTCGLANFILINNKIYMNILHSNYSKEITSSNLIENRNFDWNFKDINNDGVLDLIETIYVKYEYETTQNDIYGEQIDNRYKKSKKNFKKINKYIFDINGSKFYDWE